jgi:subtilisin family serine protease
MRAKCDAFVRPWWIHAALVAIALADPGHAQKLAKVLQPVAGEVLVCATPGSEDQVAAAIEGLGMRVLERGALSGVLRVAVPIGHEDSWMDAWSLWPDVSYAERNGVGSGGWIPDDTHFGAQWHLRNTGQFGGTPGADIEVVPAWDMIAGSPSVVIAVLDSGIDSDHPEFAGRIDPDGMDFVDSDDDPEADHPHGTWVSGCIAANADNAFAVAGVDRGCTILPVKVLDRFNRGNAFDLAQGLDYAASQADVRIVSMSLINYPSNNTLRNALRRARDAGKILIACAGNGGLGNANQSFPGASPFTISIGATRSDDARALFSGTGIALDFVAPGDGVVTVLHGSSVDAFSVVSGCSFATPIAAGVVGLLLDLADRLDVTLDQDAIYGLLVAGAEDQVGRPSEDTPGRDNFHGYGRINALETLLALGAVLTLDAMPGSCTNPLDTKSQGALPVVLLGTTLVDVTGVDVASVRISRADGVGGDVGAAQGPPGPSSFLADLGTAVPGEPYECSALLGDGTLDLSLKFSTQAVVAALGLDGLPAGSSVELVLRGTFLDGRTFVASDRVTLVPKALGLAAR